MGLIALLVATMLAGAPVQAQPTGSSSAAETSSTTQEVNQSPESATTNPDAIPVSLDKIREALQNTPAVSLRTLDQRPTFRVQIRERQKIEELLSALHFTTPPTPGGGLYGFEQQRQMFPSVDNPLRQPYAAFSQPELLTILVENLVGRYLVGRALSKITSAERARAEAMAREEVHTAIGDYCAAQANGGAGVGICSSPER